MRVSAVSITSKPACSAAFSRSPLVKVDQPSSSVVRTVWPTKWRRRPQGIFLSSRMKGTLPLCVLVDLEHVLHCRSEPVVFNHVLCGLAQVHALDHRVGWHAGIVA